MNINGHSELFFNAIKERELNILESHGFSTVVAPSIYFTKRSLNSDSMVNSLTEKLISLGYDHFEVQFLGGNEMRFEIIDLQAKAFQNGLDEWVRIEGEEGRDVSEAADRIKEAYECNERVLDLSSLSLTNLPKEVGFLSHLVELNLSHNRLNDLPSEITTLNKMQVLLLGNNQLTELPDQIGLLESLRVLDIQSNQRLSALPLSIGECFKLRQICIDGTNISLEYLKERLLPISKKAKEKARMIQHLFRSFSLKKNRLANLERKKRIKKEPFVSTLIDTEDKKVLSMEKLKEWRNVNNDLLIQVVSDTEEETLVIQNGNIIELIFKNLNKLQANDVEVARTTSFHVIRCEKDELQAAALFKMDQTRVENMVEKRLPLYISYISSAPWNLRVSTILGHEKKVMGAGTALIESAIYESIKKGTKGAVALESVPCAREFYEKLGFEEKTWRPSEYSLIPMELSPKRAREFLASERAGRSMAS